tara:strand:- start:686 stop:820 length:135 start_codon:yes stop_codon:yes gene_type:complete
LLAADLVDSILSMLVVAVALVLLELDPYQSADHLHQLLRLVLEA